jgi:glycosidase
MVPTGFWNELRPMLEAIKPVFMLAESDAPELDEKSFDMTYDWKFHHLMNDIAKGKKSVMDIPPHFNKVDSMFPGNAYVMEFTSNHDENTWNGSEYERLGPGALAFGVVAATIYGMPLIYNGQESGFARRLRFFDKDSIDWGTYKLSGFYHTLFDLKHRNKALWNGEEGGRFQRIKTSCDSSVIAFVRKKESSQVLVICNLSAKPCKVKISTDLLHGVYQDVFSEGKWTFPGDLKLDLTPWQYIVCERKE